MKNQTKIAHILNQNPSVRRRRTSPLEKGRSTKIALFFGGKISRHLVLIKKAAKKLGVHLDLVSYNRVVFDTESLKVRIRENLEGWPQGTTRTLEPNICDYDVLFFRTTGKHWEEVDLVVKEVEKGGHKTRLYIVDPIVLSGKPSMACKAYQMLALKSAGIEVPKSTYGSLWYLYEEMKGAHKGCPYNFPVIIKGSGGDRGTRVFKADNLQDLEKLVRDLRKTETEEGKRYMLQEFIPNNGDYRVLVLGKKVLGVMKRSSQSLEEFKNNYSAGGKVEVATLPQNILDLAVKAAEVCGLAVAGVDVMAKHNSQLSINNFQLKEKKEMSNDPKDYVILEVNKGPQFKGFMQATGIDVPLEIVKFLVELSQNPNNQLPISK